MKLWFWHPYAVLAANEEDARQALCAATEDRAFLLAKWPKGEAE